jgi:hypothetical protein
MAITQERQNNLDAAEDPHGAAVATIMELYGRLLKEQGREDDSKRMLAQASGIRQD